MLTEKGKLQLRGSQLQMDWEKLQLDLLEVCGELSFNRERDLGLCSSFKSEIPLWKRS